jgi:GT2 family glycosyltransferase
MSIENTFIIPILRSDYITKCLDTLYKYTSGNFKVIVIDQTKDKKMYYENKNKVHLWINSYRNLGFAKACNEGMIHALHWRSEYITCWNDDVECLHRDWWQGILDTFNMESQNEILAVCPESVKIPLWGYGRPMNEYVEILDYKDNFTDEDYQFLLDGHFDHLTKKYPELPKTFPLEYHGVCDAFAAFAPVFKRKHFELIGLWDERFYPGGAEDYDMMTRIYSKEYRAVSTRSSWVWHHWGKSKDEQVKAQEMSLPIESKYNWADTTYLWPPEWNEGHGMDVWGKYDGKDGTRKSFKRRAEIGRVEV